MALIAKLVTVTFITRIVVDEAFDNTITDFSFESNDSFDESLKKNILDKINNGEIMECIDSIVNDIESPYSTFDSEKLEK